MNTIKTINALVNNAEASSDIAMKAAVSLLVETQTIYALIREDEFRGGNWFFVDAILPDSGVELIASALVEGGDSFSTSENSMCTLAASILGYDVRVNLNYMIGRSDYEHRSAIQRAISIRTGLEPFDASLLRLGWDNEFEG